MAEWEHAAKMLMVHFRIALKGALPFKLDWDTYVQQQQQQQAQESSPSTASATTQTTNASRSNKKKSIESVLERAHLSAEAVKFMGYVRGELRHREGDFEKLRKKEDRRDYNHDLIWVSQLFLDEEGEA